MTMTTSTTVGPIALTTTGEQTGYWLGIFQADVQKTNNTLTWTGVSMSPDGFNAEGPFTYAVPASVASNTSTPVGNTSDIARADNVAIEAGSVSVRVNNFNGALANAADNATFSAYGQGLLLDTWGNNDAVLADNNNDTIAAGGSGDRLTVSGVGDTVALDASFSGFFTQTEQISDGQHYGAAATIVVGGGDNSVLPSSPVTVNMDLQANNSIILQDPVGQDILVMHNGGNTVQASSGSDTIYASAGNDVIHAGGAELLFVGAASGDGGLDGKANITRNDGTYYGTVGVSTITGGSGNATVFAEAGVVFNEGTGSNVFIGGSVADLTALNQGSSIKFAGNISTAPIPVKPLQAFHSTVTGGASGTNLDFGSTVGDLYNGGGSNNTYVNGGGADTISGGTSAPVVFGNSGGSDQLVNTKGGILVANGSNDTIDASASNGGNTFFVNNSASVGNTTLVGSSAAPTNLSDAFVVSNNNGGAAAHTLAIMGFHTGDALFLSGYSATDDQTFANAVASHAGSANFAVTLSDQTTIQFVGAHPTATFNSGMVAL